MRLCAASVVVRRGKRAQRREALRDDFISNTEESTDGD